MRKIWQVLAVVSVAGLFGAAHAQSPCSTAADCGPGGWWCQYPPGICYAEEPLGTCTPQYDVCIQVWEPVCGCDFQTHTNAACAAVAGVSVLYDGVCGPPVCGGYLGIVCPEGQYCDVDVGQCGIYFGFCQSSPASCADACEPVCGCNGLNYANACDATADGTSVLGEGGCDSATDRIIGGVAFEDPSTLVWQPEPGALAYNVYRESVAASPPTDMGVCVVASLTETAWTSQDDPLPGEAWLIQVTGVFEDGEGPMGMGSACTLREPLASCD